MSDSSGSWASDSSSERSYRSETYDSVCAFRTPQFHDQECSRYFDCPTHTIERATSDIPDEDDLEGEEEANSTGEEEEAIRMTGHDNENVIANDDEDGHGEMTNRHRQGDEPSPLDDEGLNSRQRGKAPERVGTRREVVDLTTSSPEPTRQPSPEPGPSSAAGISASRAGAASQQEPIVVDLTGDTPSPAPIAEAEPSGGERALPTLPAVGSDLSISSTRRATGSESPSRQRRPATPPSPPPPTRRRTSTTNLGPASRSTLAQPQRPPEDRRPSDIILPRWQPDAEVTLCPICHTQFSIFVRKHHCRYAVPMIAGLIVFPC